MFESPAAGGILGQPIFITGPAISTATMTFSPLHASYAVLPGPITTYYGRICALTSIYHIDSTFDFSVLCTNGGYTRREGPEHRKPDSRGRMTR
jgi:hypothetical protein